MDHEYAYLAYFVKLKPVDARGADADSFKSDGSEAGESQSSRSSGDAEEPEPAAPGAPEHITDEGAATFDAFADPVDPPLEADEDDHDDGSSPPPRKRQRSE